MRAPKGSKADEAWRGMTVRRFFFSSSSEHAEFADLAADACRSEIASGTYQAIVLPDLSEDLDIFEKELGPALQVFVRAGGFVAFRWVPRAHDDALVLLLQRLFDTEWQSEPTSGGELRWIAATENDQFSETFGERARDFYSIAPWVLLTKVPPLTRMRVPPLIGPHRGVSSDTCGISSYTN